ncbi:arginase [Bdellovibrio bacteriovorus]|uniref:arginase n=1 Tax=Bdellovibrio bacteriovorus TaxID=959 RepID=UPI0035A6D850
MKEINFLGLGFEVGQEQNGLKSSHEYFRQYFPFLKKQGYKLIDCGEVLSHDPYGTKLRSADELPAFNWLPYKEAYARIQYLLKQPEVLLNWGGDHSVALATVGAFASQNPDGYVVWIDAHTDVNLPEHSLSGNLHGMPLSILLNVQGIASAHFSWIQNVLPADRLIYVGVRDLDPFEKEIVQELGITVFTASDIRSLGMGTVSRKVLSQVHGKPLHVSFDIDSLSPEVAPSTGVPVSDGLTLDDVMTLGRTLSQHPSLRSVDIVEVNPSLGSADDVFKTYFAALQFLMSLIHQGEIHDGISRSVKANHAASLESSP